MGKLKTTVKKVRLMTKKGDIQTSAYCVGPFAVHHSPGMMHNITRWTVTEIHTGMALIQHLSKKSVALEFVEKVLPLPIAWDKMTDDVHDDDYHKFMSDESYKALRKLYIEYRGR